MDVKINAPHHGRLLCMNFGLVNLELKSSTSMIRPITEFIIIHDAQNVCAHPYVSWAYAGSIKGEGVGNFCFMIWDSCIP